MYMDEFEDITLICLPCLGRGKFLPAINIRTREEHEEKVYDDAGDFVCKFCVGKGFIYVTRKVCTCR